jgi:hypothetical protein
LLWIGPRVPRPYSGPLAPTAGEEVEKIVARICATPRVVVERVRKFITP